MYFTPRISSDYFFKNSTLKYLEVPFTPLINGVKHLKAILFDPSFNNNINKTPVSKKLYSLSSITRKFGHIIFASLELGGIVNAIYQLSKNRVFNTSLIVNLGISLFTTLADVYLQRSSKEKSENQHRNYTQRNEQKEREEREQQQKIALETMQRNDIQRSEQKEREQQQKITLEKFQKTSKDNKLLPLTEQSFGTPLTEQSFGTPLTEQSFDSSSTEQSFGTPLSSEIESENSSD